VVAGTPVTVTHSCGHYPVYVECGILAELESLVTRHLPERRVAMLADATALALLQAGRFGRPPWEGETLAFEAGERSKTREEWGRLTDGLLQGGFGRDSGIVALGGGVAGDLAGFVAATYLRGLPYLNVPTTLLAMVDASVGGKTGVDTPEGKNLVGAFWPPVGVVADPRVLGSLPEEHYRGGLAEAVKHGLIADADYFGWIEREADAIGRREESAVTRLIRRSVEIKAAVVADDEREAGRRAILNAGHTVAHALERVTGYGIPHGDAVALGLVAECDLAERLGGAATGLRTRVAGLLTRLGLPVRTVVPREGVGSLAEAMTRDKKNRESRIHFALPRAIGTMESAAGWTRDAPRDAIMRSLASIM